MSLFGFTGVEISPHLHLHYQPKWNCLCCCGDDPKDHGLDTVYYINRKMEVKLANGHKGDDGLAASHARLKMIVIKALVPLTDHPFHNAERTFKIAKVSWNDPEVLYKETLGRIDAAFDRVKQEVLGDPLELDDRDSLDEDCE